MHLKFQVKTGITETVLRCIRWRHGGGKSGLSEWATEEGAGLLSSRRRDSEVSTFGVAQKQ